MTIRTFCTLAAAIFALIALLQLIRIVMGWSVTLNGVDVPFLGELDCRHRGRHVELRRLPAPPCAAKGRQSPPRPICRRVARLVICAYAAATASVRQTFSGRRYDALRLSRISLSIFPGRIEPPMPVPS